MSADLSRIKAAIAANQKAGRESYHGLQSWEIGDYNRSLMFGENDEAFPSDSEWSAWVD